VSGCNNNFKLQFLLFARNKKKDEVITLLQSLPGREGGRFTMFLYGKNGGRLDYQPELN
jgi:hypothetical protein